MNQDETTKSLSDKVLDRAIIIYFPRPTTLKRRTVLRPLDETNRGSGLPLSTWQSWLVRESTFGEDDVYNQQHAEGFIRLFSLPSRIRAMLGLNKLFGIHNTNTSGKSGASR